MREIMLQAVPNQRIDVSVGGVAWRIDIKAITGGMAASVWADNELLISGTRVLANSLILPFKYLSIYGNFVIDTGGNPIDWRKFGRSQSLYFIELDELP